MAGRTNTEIIRELEIQSALLDERMAQSSFSLANLNDRVRKEEELIATFEKRISVVETRILDLTRRLDDKDRWQSNLWVALLWGNLGVSPKSLIVGNSVHPGKQACLILTLDLPLLFQIRLP